MASKRRGGFRPPELRGALGTLLRTTTDAVRDVLERGACEGRARLDDVRSSRRRQDSLAELGELVLDLIRRGEIDLAELPEARDLVRELDQLDEDAPYEADAEPEPPRPTTRHRFDDRPRPRPRDTADDGTVSSGATSRSSRRPTAPGRPRRDDADATRAPTRPIKGVWHPDPEAADASTQKPSPRHPPLPHAPQRKGGISFDDDDDDLSQYMHPDDVPPKNGGDGDA